MSLLERIIQKSLRIKTTDGPDFNEDGLIVVNVEVDARLTTFLLKTLKTLVRVIRFILGVLSK